MTDHRRDLEPVSVGITRRVKADQVEAFDGWLHEIRTTVAGFDGYAGMDVVQPVDPANLTYVIILRFDSYEQYRAWHESPERGRAVDRAAGFTVGRPVLEEAHGLEGWFTPSAAPASLQRPARYKMAVLTTVALYPLIVLVGALVAALTDVPAVLATLITVSVVAPLATYSAMPAITRVFRRWLYP